VGGRLNEKKRDGEVFLARIILFAVVGAVTGAAAVEPIGLLSTENQQLRAMFTLPGLIFGVAFSVALLRFKFVSMAAAFAYVAASTLSHMAAVTTVLAIGPINPSFPILDLLSGRAGFSFTGFSAGAVGGGLLAGATALLIRRLQWPLLIVAGAVLGAFLPLTDLGLGGFFLFYAIWQGGYAATLAAILPRAADKLARLST